MKNVEEVIESLVKEDGEISNDYPRIIEIIARELAKYGNTGNDYDFYQRHNETNVWMGISTVADDVSIVGHLIIFEFEIQMDVPNPENPDWSTTIHSRAIETVLNFTEIQIAAAVELAVQHARQDFNKMVWYASRILNIPYRP